MFPRLGNTSDFLVLVMVVTVTSTTAVPRSSSLRWDSRCKQWDFGFLGSLGRTAGVGLVSEFERSEQRSLPWCPRLWSSGYVTNVCRKMVLITGGLRLDPFTQVTTIRERRAYTTVNYYLRQVVDHRHIWTGSCRNLSFLNPVFLGFSDGGNGNFDDGRSAFVIVCLRGLVRTGMSAMLIYWIPVIWRE